jgi:hypothetical protein
LRVGRVPALVVSILHAFDQAGLASDLTVVDTHALFAYETAAGVRIAPISPVAREADPLWDATKRVSFVAGSNRLDTSMLRVLQWADRSFQREGDCDQKAINDKGFEVVFLDRHREGKEHWSLPPGDANNLNDVPRFEQLVVSATGTMALMRAIDPRVFVKLKRWRATHGRDRTPVQRHRDASQAAFVQTLLDEQLLITTHLRHRPS